jgi:hypothetical protein
VKHVARSHLSVDSSYSGVTVLIPRFVSKVYWRQCQAKGHYQVYLYVCLHVRTAKIAASSLIGAPM